MVFFRNLYRVAAYPGYYRSRFRRAYRRINNYFGGPSSVAHSGSARTTINRNPLANYLGLPATASKYGNRNVSRGGRKRRRFMNRTRKPKVIRSRFKRSRKSVTKSAPYKGVESRYESGGILTDDYCVTIGHSTGLSQLRRTFFTAIVKKLLVKMGLNTPSCQLGNQALTLNDVFYIYFSQTDSSLANPISNVSYVCAGNDTLNQIADGFISSFMDTPIAGTYRKIRLEYAYFYPNGAGDLTACRVSLRDTMVRWYSTSVLKMQNRTSDGINNTESDDLVAQHVVGKSYFGNGNGLFPKATSELGAAAEFNLALLANPSTGLIGQSNLSTLNSPNLKEPQEKSFFMNVSGCHGIQIQPGHVKRSYLKSEYAQNINDFIDVILTYDNSQAVKANAQRNPIHWNKCKYRAFMIEKEIETEAGAPLNPVTISYEIDNTVGVVLETKMNTYTNRLQLIGTTAVLAPL